MCGTPAATSPPGCRVAAEINYLEGRGQGRDTLHLPPGHPATTFGRERQPGSSVSSLASPSGAHHRAISNTIHRI